MVVPPVVMALPAVAIAATVGYQVWRYRRDVRAARGDVRFVPSSARAHGSRRPVPPAVDRSRRP